MNPATLIAKQKNTRNVLNHIIKCEEVSRPVLASTFKISTATVTNIVNELMENNIVYEGRSENAGLGRRAKLIRFNSKLYYVVTVSIPDPSTIKMCICDLLGHVVRTREDAVDFFLSEGNPESQIVSNTIESITQFIEGQPPEIKSKLCAVAISLPGLLTYDQTIHAPFMNWRSMPLQKPLEAAVKLPVYMENITRIKSIYEIRHLSENAKNVLYMTVTPGIGIVNFFDGKMVMGKNGMSGEGGHMSLNINGEKCYCGNCGCFEMYCGERYMVRKGNGMLEGPDRDEILADIVQRSGRSLTINAMLEARRAGSLKMHSIFAEAAKYLGAGIANLVNIYDPDKIIISGALVELDDFIYSMALEEAKSRIVNKFTRDIPISIGKLKVSEIERAICAFVLDKIFDLLIKQQ